ncbi:hypothetical protein FF32_16705 [Halomonas campaniensis]|nr:hypothetical protein FF32_16705 [Halomonas campaniensis]
MSGLSFMEKLLDGVEVQWRPLGEVATIYGGLTGKSKSDFDSGNAKYVSYKNIFNNIHVDPNQLELVKVESHERQHLVEHGDILFTGSSEIASEAGMSCAVTTKFNFPVYLNSFSFGVRFNEGLNITPEFSKYLFRSRFMRTEIAKSANGVTRFNVSKTRFKKTLIPILCPDNPKKSLRIQAEIVRILDTFTELTAELTAELNARKQQYNHYRDQLLSFEEGEVEWKTLDYLCASISAGGDVPKNSSKGQAEPTAEYPYPIYANATDEKGLYGFTNDYKIDSDAVTISARGAKVGYHTVREAKFTPIIRLIVLVTNKELISTKYLNYALGMSPIGGTDAGIPQLTVPMVKKLTAPIPYAEDPKKSLAEQDRIVAILDKFDTLTASISEGLPREIELRQKQYEYYRDLLLNFPKPDEEGA